MSNNKQFTITLSERQLKLLSTQAPSGTKGTLR